ncbi:MAG: Asp-tRNA(Asn)/Glu-tRNA(Gln) amidotransferase subunit GatC [Actinomycetota bacterium]
MTISRSDVEHVATLARLALSDDELELYGEQLGRILAHAERVTSLDTEGVSPTSHPLRLANVFRPDEVGNPAPCLSQKAALANGPAVESGHFKVPRILDAPAAFEDQE